MPSLTRRAFSLTVTDQLPAAGAEHGTSLLKAQIITLIKFIGISGKQSEKGHRNWWKKREQEPVVAFFFLLPVPDKLFAKRSLSGRLI